MISKIQQSRRCNRACLTVGAVCVCLSVWQSNWWDQSPEENAGNAGVWIPVREWTVNQPGWNVGDLPSLQNPHPAPQWTQCILNEPMLAAPTWVTNKARIQVSSRDNMLEDERDGALSKTCSSGTLSKTRWKRKWVRKKKKQCVCPSSQKNPLVQQR